MKVVFKYINNTIKNKNWQVNSTLKQKESSRYSISSNYEFCNFVGSLLPCTTSSQGVFKGKVVILQERFPMLYHMFI
jgi:hypothetical protein